MKIFRKKPFGLKKPTILFIVTFLLLNIFIIGPEPMTLAYPASALRFGNDTNLSNADASFIGENANDTELGEFIYNEIAIAGDVNGDGYDDILIGSRSNNVSGIYSGKVYLIFGKASGLSMDMNISNADASFIGEGARHQAGTCVAGAGDVNNDGYDDFLIGAPGYNVKGTPWYPMTGKVYLIFGRASGWSMDINLSTSNASFVGEYGNDGTGWAVAGAGDFNNDGFDDIMISADRNDEGGGYQPGQVYLIFGRRSGWSKNMDLSNSNASFLGFDYGNYGYLTAGCGDVNRDGYDDIIISPASNPKEFPGSYIIFGRDTGLSMDMNIYQAANASIIMDDTSWPSTSTRACDGAGDVNGDGYDDIMIANPFKNNGITFIFFGKTTGWKMNESVHNANASFIGEKPDDMSGSSLAGAGDVNGDGYDDMLIGAYRHPYGDNTSNDWFKGKAYLILGREGPWSNNISLANSDASFVGEERHNKAGKSVAGGGDVNGDGYDDIIIHAPYNREAPGLGAGKVYLLFPHLNEGPKVVYSVKAYSNPAYTNEITIANIGDTVYVELMALDENATEINNALVNVTIKNDPSNRIQINLIETGASTGTFRSSFRIAEITYPGKSQIGANIGDNILLFSTMDRTKNTTFLVSTPVQLRPLSDKTSVFEDNDHFMHYYSYGYNTVTQWTFDTNASWLAWDGEKHDLYGTPDNSDVGIYWVQVNITDGLGNYDEHYFNINVENTPPDITTENIIYSKEDDLYIINYNSTDDGQGVVRWFVVSDATWLNMNSITGELSGTPTNDDRGSYWVNVSVDDGNGGSAWSNFTLDVVNVNDLPLITTQDVTMVNEDEKYIVDYEVMDIDGDTLFEWTLNTNALWLSINNTNGELSGTPLNEHVGTYIVNVTVSDLNGGEDDHNFSLEVINVNDPPEWMTVPPDTEVNESETFSFDIDALDVDAGDVLSYGIVIQTDTNVTIDQKTGMLEYTAKLDKLRTSPYVFTVRASASDGEITIWTTFDISVIPNPRPNVRLMSPADKSIISGIRTEFKWVGLDKENEALIYDLYLSKDMDAVVDLQESVCVLKNILNVTYTMSDLDAGEIYYWTVIPYDGVNYGTCLSGIFQFSVNSPPVILPLKVSKITAGVEQTFEFNVADNVPDDEGDLEYGLEDAPDGMTIDPVTGIISWEPTEEQIGTHTVKVSVSDGIDSTNITFEIMVTDEDPGTVDKSSTTPFLITITAFSIFFIIIFSFFVVGTEFGKYKFLSIAVVPLYNKLNQDKVMYNFLRGEIFGFIKAKPGEHYNSIKNELRLNNGTLVHHARILEKEGFIISRRDGLNTKFYARGTKIPEPATLHQELLDIIRKQPGITQRDIVTIAESSQQVVSYNLKKFERDDQIRIEKNGRENRYYINENYVDPDQQQLINGADHLPTQQVNSPQVQPVQQNPIGPNAVNAVSPQTVPKTAVDNKQNTDQ